MTDTKRHTFLARLIDRWRRYRARRAAIKRMRKTLRQVLRKP